MNSRLTGNIFVDGRDVNLLSILDSIPKRKYFALFSKDYFICVVYKRSLGSYLFELSGSRVIESRNFVAKYLSEHSASLYEISDTFELVGTDHNQANHDNYYVAVCKGKDRICTDLNSSILSTSSSWLYDNLTGIFYILDKDDHLVYTKYNLYHIV